MTTGKYEKDDLYFVLPVNDIPPHDLEFDASVIGMETDSPRLVLLQGNRRTSYYRTSSLRDEGGKDIAWRYCETAIPKPGSQLIIVTL